MRRNDEQGSLAPDNQVVAMPPMSSNIVPPSSGNKDLAIAAQLYERVKSLSQELQKRPDVTTARLIIESVDDAITEFGSTNQDKKVELRKIKEQAERILPPDTLESLKKRAEGEFLRKLYPKQKAFRMLMFIAILMIPSALVLREFLIKKEPTIQSETEPRTDGRALSEQDKSRRLEPANEGPQVEEHGASSAQIANMQSQHLKRAQTLFEQADYQAALEECNKALNLEPGNKDALNLKKRIEETLKVLR